MTDQPNKPAPGPAIRRRRGPRPRQVLGADHPIVRREIETATVDDETVLMNTRAGVLYGFGGVGERIWTMLDEPVRPSQIVATLSKEFDVDEERCEQETRAFLVQMMREGLVTRAVADTDE